MATVSALADAETFSSSERALTDSDWLRLNQWEGWQPLATEVQLRDWTWEIAGAAYSAADPDSAEIEWAEYVAEKLHDAYDDESRPLIATVGRLAYELARADGHDEDDADAIACERMDEARQDYRELVSDHRSEAIEAVARTATATMPRPLPSPRGEPPRDAPLGVDRGSVRRFRPRPRRRRRAAARSPGRTTGEDPEPPRPPLAVRRKAGV